MNIGRDRSFSTLLCLGCLVFWLPDAGHAVDAAEVTLGLKARGHVFTEGVIEARESGWNVTAQQAAEIEAEAAVLSSSVVPAERALEFARKFERVLLDKLGRARQRGWAYFCNPATAKLMEVPLVPGEDPGKPIQSPSEGIRWTAYADGIVARFDEDRKTMTLSSGTSDAAFPFRPTEIDPTLQDFALYDALKRGDRGVRLIPGGGNTFRGTLRREGNTIQFFFVGDSADLRLVRREESDEANFVVARDFFGSYGRIGDGGAAVPYSALRVTYESRTRASLRMFTVTRWTARAVSAREAEIKVPRDTRILREAGLPD